MINRLFVVIVVVLTASQIVQAQDSADTSPSEDSRKEKDASKMGVQEDGAEKIEENSQSTRFFTNEDYVAADVGHEPDRSFVFRYTPLGYQVGVEKHPLLYVSLMLNVDENHGYTGTPLIHAVLNRDTKYRDPKVVPVYFRDNSNLLLHCILKVMATHKDTGNEVRICTITIDATLYLQIFEVLLGASVLQEPGFHMGARFEAARNKNVIATRRVDQGDRVGPNREFNEHSTRNTGLDLQVDP